MLAGLRLFENHCFWNSRRNYGERPNGEAELPGGFAAPAHVGNRLQKRNQPQFRRAI